MKQCFGRKESIVKIVHQCIMNEAHQIIIKKVGFGTFKEATSRTVPKVSDLPDSPHIYTNIFAETMFQGYMGLWTVPSFCTFFKSPLIDQHYQNFPGDCFKKLNILAYGIGK